MKYIFYNICSVILFYPTLFAQSEYLNNSDSGLGISLGVSSIQINSNSVNSSGIEFGFSFNSKFDINAEYVKSDESIATDFGISIPMDHQTTKKNATVAINVFDQCSHGAGNLGIGFSVAHNFTYNEPFMILSDLNFTLFPSLQQSEFKKRAIVIVTAGLSMGWKNINGHTIVLIPSVAYGEKYFIIGASLAMIIDVSNI